MMLTPLQRLQLKTYIDTVITLDRFLRSTQEPPPGPSRDAYWLERANLEEDRRNKYDGFVSSLTWARPRDCDGAL